MEVISSGGLPLISDVRGLRESGSEAALTFSLNSPSQLASLLSLAACPHSREWLLCLLSSRFKRRLSRLNPDLFALAFLALARKLASS